ncbi:small VCP/p97-interacting protein-like [Pomacea canaliculata]|uniref:small VCP/p97-interacting protein-like n=1 Tax=Pomacea canaliculata TaxID=400727 RepID=UPI000D72BBBE|nr:small VCP/p97-interacting protein-like [Pomacea canaliculata]
MGMCLPCLGGSSDDYDQPSPETRRRQLAEAAEKRQKETEARGVKDPDALKRKQKRKEELERQEASRPVNEDGPLKWQVS